MSSKCLYFFNRHIVSEKAFNSNRPGRIERERVAIGPSDSDAASNMPIVEDAITSSKGLSNNNSVEIHITPSLLPGAEWNYQVDCVSVPHCHHTCCCCKVRQECPSCVTPSLAYEMCSLLRVAIRILPVRIRPAH